MSDQLSDSAERLFAEHCGPEMLKSADDGAFPQRLWEAVTEAGFTAALLPEDADGFGATVAEAMRILQIAAGTRRRSRWPRPCSRAGCWPRPGSPCRTAR